MKKLSIFLVLVWMLSSCATASVETISKVGATCKASYSTFYKDIEGLKLNACHASGEAASSQVDPLIQALLEAIKARR